MKILLLYPNRVLVTRMQLGLAYLSTYLKKAGHEIDLFDTTFIKCGDSKSDEEHRENSLQVINPDLLKYGLYEREGDVYAEFQDAVDTFNPDIIATSIVDPNYTFSLSLLRHIKKYRSEIITVAGGPTPTYAPEEVIAEDCVDYICVGEGEKPIIELVNNLENNDDVTSIPNIWCKTNGEIKKNAIRDALDVNELLYPDWDIFDDRHIWRPMAGKMYRLGMFAMSRGCTFKCAYCSNSVLVQLYKNKGTFYRVKKPETFIKELKHFKEKYNLNFIFFTDDLFPLHRISLIRKEDTSSMLEEFVALYKEHINLPFSVNLYPELIKKDSFKKLVDAGLANICVGLESGSNEIRVNILKRKYKNEQIVKVFNWAKEYNVRSSSFNMIGLPHETRSQILETMLLNNEAKPTTNTVTYFHPYRGETLRNLCIKEGLFNPDDENDYEDQYREGSLLDLPQISQQELNGLFKTFSLYAKLPKSLHWLIKYAEGESWGSNFVYEKLKKVWSRLTKNDMVWDFTNHLKENSINGNTTTTGSDETIPHVKSGADTVDVSSPLK